MQKNITMHYQFSFVRITIAKDEIKMVGEGRRKGSPHSLIEGIGTAPMENYVEVLQKIEIEDRD